MTLILKSDKTAMNTIGNAYGIKGATDFVAVLDFNRDVYKYKDNGSFVDTDLASAISLARTSAAEYKDLNNSTQVAAANEPRLHYMQDKGVRGLLIEPARTNLFANPNTPVTQTVSVPTTGSAKGLILSIEGTGSATMSGAIGVTNIAAATQGNPQACIPSYANSTASVTVTLTGNVTRVQLEQAAATAGGGCASTFVPSGITERKGDVVKLGSALSALLPSVKTVVAQYVYFDRVVAGLASTVNVFALEDSARASGGIYVSRGRTASDTLTLKTYTVAPNTTTIEKTLATPITKNTVATMAVSFDEGGANLHHAINGYVVEVAGSNTPVTANAMTIGSKNQHSSATAEAGGILTRLVMFDRKLSVAELQEITRSWT